MLHSLVGSVAFQMMQRLNADLLNVGAMLFNDRYLDRVVILDSSMVKVNRCHRVDNLPNEYPHLHVVPPKENTQEH